MTGRILRNDGVDCWDRAFCNMCGQSHLIKVCDQQPALNRRDVDRCRHKQLQNFAQLDNDAIRVLHLIMLVHALVDYQKRYTILRGGASDGSFCLSPAS